MSRRLEPLCGSDFPPVGTGTSQSTYGRFLGGVGEGRWLIPIPCPLQVTPLEGGERL